MKIARKNPIGMSVVLLIKLEDYDKLYRVSTFEGVPFQIWADQDGGIDLFWKGRRVETVYSMGRSPDCWWSVPMPSAYSSLRRRGKASVVKWMPAPEGELPS
jgi:hypothetical protein